MIGVLASAAFILVVLVDAFEAMILPRRVMHRIQLALRRSLAASGPLPRELAQPVRAAVAPGAVRHLDARLDDRLRLLALVARHRAAHARRAARFCHLLLSQRGHALDPGLRRRR